MKEKTFQGTSLQMFLPLIMNDGSELTEHLTITGANELPLGTPQVVAVSRGERSKLVTQTLECV
jgi:hypothetical protein